MNTGIKGLAMLVRDLMGYPEDIIQIGRDNRVRKNDDRRLVIVDAVADSTPVASGEKFDADAEKMTYTQRESMPATLNFYGDTAYEMARDFRLLVRSQSSREIQRRYGITVFNVSAATNLKSLSGTQHSGRYQMRLNVSYNESIEVDTLRIDTLKTTLITD